MKTALLAAACLFMAIAPAAHAIEPIEGSITFKGQPRTKLTKAPIGSIVPHQFYDKFGRDVNEIYIIQPDRSLKLTSRVIRDDMFSDD